MGKRANLGHLKHSDMSRKAEQTSNMDRQGH